MRKSKVLGKDILTITILTTVAAVTWIALDIYRIFRKPLVLDVSKKQLEALDPNFDKKTLEALKQRKIINQQELDSVPELVEFRLTPKEATPSVTKEASPSGQKISTQTP